MEEHARLVVCSLDEALGDLTATLLPDGRVVVIGVSWGDEEDDPGADGQQCGEAAVEKALPGEIENSHGQCVTRLM